jgi:hypothetical protein
MRIPKIKIEYDLGKEIDLFSIGLHDEIKSWKRPMIFYSFPKLEGLLKNNSSEKELLRRFILDYRERNKEKIEAIVKEAEKSFDKSEEYLSKLAELMDYEWKEDARDYIAMPVILPYSPFNYETNTFYFSILGQIRGFKTQTPLEVALHEISHFILAEKVEEKSYDNVKEVVAEMILKRIKL